MNKPDCLHRLSKFVEASDSVIGNLRKRVTSVGNSIGNINVRVMRGHTAESINNRKEEISKDLSDLEKDVDFIVEFAKLFNEETKELQAVIQDSKNNLEP